MNIKKVFRSPLSSFKRFCLRRKMHFYSSKFIPDAVAVRGLFKARLGYKLNLNDPKTFNEKTNWLKLYYRHDEFSKMVNKYESKIIVSNILGEQYVIPSIAVYDRWEDIDFNLLEPPYVIKTTHASGVVFVIKDSSDLNNLTAIKNRVKESLKQNYFYRSREWPYKNCKRQILIEKYVQDSNNNNLPVFKFFCFNGSPYLVQTIQNDKTSNESIDYFDMNWNRLDLRQNFKNSENPFEKPTNFEEMKSVAAKLSNGFPFIRIDLYSINGKTYFSEYTFYSDSGLEKFDPADWDNRLGSLIDLSLCKLI